jgi:Flp pilus assembly protein TadG
MIKKLFLRFLNDQKGATAIEFAFLAPLYFLMIGAIFLVGIVLFVKVLLTAAANEAAIAIVFNHPSTTQTSDYYKAVVDPIIKRFVFFSPIITYTDQLTSLAPHTVGCTISTQNFSNVPNSPILCAVKIGYKMPFDIPLLVDSFNTDIFFISAAGYSAVVGLKPS